MGYVDGFVIPVPKARLADDAPVGRLTSFPRSVKPKEDGVAVFSFILYRSRAHRDKANRLAMDDRRFAKMDMKAMPFDGRRPIHGGFKTIVSA